MTTTLDVQRSGPVARVFLNRPEVRNAFNDGVITELTQTFTALAADSTLRCIVLGGHGKAFCAGADLNWPLFCLPNNVYKSPYIMRRLNTELSVN